MIFQKGHSVDSADAGELSTQRLGAAVRRARKSTGRSLVNVAAEIGSSQSLLSQIENGKIYPSVSTLYRLADALNVAVGTLMGQSVHRRAVVHRAGSAPTLPHGQSAQTDESQVLTSPDAGTLLFGLLHTMCGDQIDEDVYSHEGEDLLYVLEGSLTVHSGEETYRLAVGDSLHIDGRTPHWWERNSTSDLVRVLLVTGPHQ